MTRSRRFLLPLLFALASAGGAVAAGCGGLGVSSSSSLGTANDSNPSGGGTSDDSGASGAFPPGADASTTPAPVLGIKSNPLCAVKSTTCDPQLNNGDPSDAATSANGTCVSVTDAAPPDGGLFACHVTNSGGVVTPTCLSDGKSSGQCTSSTSCMAGTECVGDGSNLDGHCRHYCCDPDACDLQSFCDVQPMVAHAETMVPVCMPIATCDLLGYGTSTCPNGQQCGIALDAKGLELRTCLDLGPRGEGEECETDHCTKDLACLGAPGSRKCFQLCDANKGAGVNGCSMGQTCKTNGITFKGGNVGICGS